MFRREISVQLNASNSSGVCGLPNFIGIPVNENTDCMSIRRQRLDNLPSNFWFNVARALRIKVEPDHLCAEFDARFAHRLTFVTPQILICIPLERSACSHERCAPIERISAWTGATGRWLQAQCCRDG